MGRAFARVDVDRGYLAEVRAWKRTLDVVASLSPRLVSAADRGFLAEPFGAAQRLSHEEVHAKLLPRFEANRTGVYATPAGEKALEEARAGLVSEFSQGWPAVEAGSEDALRTLEAALAR